MNEDQKTAQWAMFRAVQQVDKRLGEFICFLYSTGSCDATHHMSDGKSISFSINDDTENPWDVVARMAAYINDLSEPQMATGPDGRWIMHEGAK